MAVVSFGGRARASSVVAVAVSPDGSGIALGGVSPVVSGRGAASGWVAVFDAATGEMVTELVPPTARARTEEISNTVGTATNWRLPPTASPASGTRLRGTSIFTPSDFARIIGPTGWEPVSVPLGPDHVAKFTAVAFLPDDDYLFTQYLPFDWQGWPGATLWNIAEGAAITRLRPAASRRPRIVCGEPRRPARREHGRRPVPM